MSTVIDPKASYNVRYLGVARTVTGAGLEWMLRNPSDVEVDLEKDGTYVSGVNFVIEQARTAQVKELNASLLNGHQHLIQNSPFLNVGPTIEARTKNRMAKEQEVRLSAELTFRAAQRQDADAPALIEQHRLLKEEYTEALANGDSYADPTP